jgi:malate synthase
MAKTARVTFELRKPLVLHLRDRVIRFEAGRHDVTAPDVIHALRQTDSAKEIAAAPQTDAVGDTAAA